MFERQRQAIDLAGQRVEIVERRESVAAESANDPAPTFFGPDGLPLAPEGGDFYRARWGVLYKLVD